MRHSVQHEGHRSAAASMVQCSRCKSLVYDKLAYCPYCGSKNNELPEGSEPVDVRKKFRLLGDTFYTVFCILSVLCGLIIILHDIFCNMISAVTDIQEFMESLKEVFYIIYFIQVGMFTYWVYVHHSNLKTIKVASKFNSAWAFSMYIPGLNLFLPEKLIYDIEDVLYNLKVREINIRSVGLWWTLWVISSIYLTVSSFIPAEGFWMVVMIACELIWGASILLQAYMLNSFKRGVAAGRHKGYESRTTYSRSNRR